MTLDQTSNRICIVGVGAATSVGDTAAITFTSVRAGVAGFVEHPDELLDEFGEPFMLALAPYLDSSILGIDRLEQLLKPALNEALDPLSDISRRIPSIPLLLGVPSPRPGLPDQLAQELVGRFEEQDSLCGGFECKVTVYPNGHSSGLMAVDAAVRMLHEEQASFCLAAGADSYFQKETLLWLQSHDQIHHPMNAWGFVPGEGAGACLLCREDVAREHELDVLGWIVASGTALEKNLIKTESVCIGEGLTEVFREVLSQLPTSAKVDFILCDQNGETYRADEFGFTMTRTAKHFIENVEFQAPADCWGDVGAASGPLFIGLASIAANKGYAKGPRTLVWTSSESGERSAVLIEAEVQM